MSVAAGATSFRIIPARFTAPRCRSGLPRTAGTTFTDSTYPIARFTTYRALPEPAAYSAGSAHTSEGGGRFHVLYTLHPKLYQMAMNYTNNGYTLRYALRRMGVQLPDEHPELF